MRNLIFVSVISVLVCGMALTGCVSDQEKPQDEIPASGLYVTGAAAVEGSLVKAAAEPVFTGDDIVSFSVSSGEIVFAEDRIEAIMSAVERHSELYFYIDGTPVFDPAIRIHPGYGETFEDFDLQFRTLGPPTYESVKVFLTDVYMNIDTLPAAERLVKQQEMEENKAKRKKELDVLIGYLDAAGKIVDVPVEPPVVDEPGPDLTGIQIKDNPCETLKYIRKINTPDFESALDSLRMLKNITSEITKVPLEALFDADDRLFYGIEYGAGKYTDVLDTKGGWYERTYKCEGEDNADDNVGDASSISGAWKVKTIRISGSLTDVVPPDDAHTKAISLMIPETDKDGITGKTFFNMIEISFKISEKQQIRFTSYGGTRSAEDDFGRAFSDHIMLNVVKFDISNDELKLIDSRDLPVIILIKNN